MANASAIEWGDVPETVKLMSDQGLPGDLGTLRLDDAGRILPRANKQPLRFSFVYCGAPFEAEVMTGAAPLVRLVAELGVPPYTIESPEARRWVMRVIQASGQLKRGRLQVSPAKGIELWAEAVPPEPQTPANIMATVSALLIDFKPYLELLSDLIAVCHGLAKSAEDSDGS